MLRCVAAHCMLMKRDKMYVKMYVKICKEINADQSCRGKIEVI